MMDRVARPVRRRVPIVAAIVLLAAGLVSACQTSSMTLQGTLHVAGAPAPVGVAVTVFSDDVEAEIAQAFTDAVGHYAFSAVALPAGAYRVRFGDGTWFGNAASWAEATTVTATASPTTVVDASISAPAGVVSGTVVRNSGRPVEAATVAAYAPGDLDTPLAATTTAADGTYHLTGLSSMSYLVKYRAPGYATRWHGGAALSAGASLVESDGSSTVAGVDAELDPEGLLTGMFVGSPVALSQVGVVAYDKSTGVAVSAGMLDAFGRFTIDGLPSGSYTVGLLDPTETFRTTVLGATSNDVTTGTGFAVTKGQTRSIGQYPVVGKGCPVVSKGLDLTGADFHGALLFGCDLSTSTLTGANFSGANLVNADFASAHLANADFTGANLNGAKFFVSDLSGAHLAAASTFRTTFNAAGLQGADFGGIPPIGVRSGNANGTPVGLAAGWTFTNGFLLGPTADLAGADLSGLDLSGRDLHGAIIWNANLTGTSLAGANLTGANFMNTRFAGTNLDGATLTGATLQGVSSSGITGVPAALPSGWVLFSGTLFGQWVTVTGADVDGADLTNADLAGITSGGLTGTPAAMPPQWALVDGYFIGPAATVTGADVDGVDLTQVNLFNVTSGGVTGTPAALPAGWQLHNGYFVGPGANLSHAQLAGLAAPGVDFTNTNLMYADLTGADLSGANLYDAHLDVANLTGADLTGANLQQVNFTRATLDGANLSSANLVDCYSGGIVGTPASLPVGRKLFNGYLLGPGAQLTYADLSGADLSGMDLSRANLQIATLDSVDLTGTNLTGAMLMRATLTISTLTGADLTDATMTELASSGNAGPPAVLPPGWALIGGVLVPPNG